MMRLHRIVVVAIAAVALAACVGDDGDTAGSTTATITNDGSTTAPSPATEDRTNRHDDDDGIDSVQWGPNDPPIPGEYSAFAVAQADGLSCDSIDRRAEGDEFWTLAADMCRVFTGEGDWPDVESVPTPPVVGNSYERCLDRELFDMLERALAWRDEHQGESPVVRYPAADNHSPCQTSLFDVGPSGAGADTYDECVNDEALRVPRPGVPVTISAPGIEGFANPQATVEGNPLCVIDTSQDNALVTFVVVVPSSGDEQMVTIEVATNYGLLQADVELPAVGSTTVEPTTVSSSTAITTATPPTQTPGSTGIPDTIQGGSGTTGDP